MFTFSLAFFIIKVETIHEVNGHEKIYIISFFATLSLLTSACSPKHNNKNDITVESNRDAYHYFYTSLAKRLDAQSNTIVSYETLLNDQVEYAKTDVIKKKGSVYYSNIHDNEIVYYNNYVYYGANYINRAEATLERFLLMSFNAFYEIELKNFLFSETLTFNEGASQNDLYVEAKIFPHTYSLTLATDKEHALKSATLGSQAYTFSREVVFSYEHPQDVTGVPLVSVLPQMTNNKTTHLNNFFEIIEAMSVYSENDSINRSVYISDNIAVYPSQPNQTCWTSKTAGRYINGNNFIYYNNNKIYVYEEDYTPYFYQKVYFNSSLSSLRFRALGYLFYTIESELFNDISKSVSGNVTEYSNLNFRVKLTGGILDSIIEILNTTYTKHVFDTTVNSITAPNNFIASDFLSDETTSDIGLAFNAYQSAAALFVEKNTYEDEDPDQTDYAFELDANVSLITAPIEVSNMMYHVFYIEVVPTIYEPEYHLGHVEAVYYSASTGIYKISNTPSLGIRYQKIA